MRNFPYRCRPKNWEQRHPYPFPTGCLFVWQRSDSACKWTSRDRTALGWLPAMDEDGSCGGSAPKAGARQMRNVTGMNLPTAQQK